MKNRTLPALLAGTAVALASCAKKEEPKPEPVKQPTVRKKAPPAPKPVAKTTNPFRTPSDDMNLPTAEQIADGKENSIGTATQPLADPTAPTVAVSPPTTPTPKPGPPKTQDRLDP